ncbi:MAG: glycosyltransferase family 39 protein [Flavobacteriales bacterium]|nr:glycosyltransferase family 39 protein [Flavobacteriales bacterium]MBK9074110.1 glycosyltransferase family 39 protein [Flavobacteriales bacterium]MBK9539715.1 glycosyltransferase family 39 protein [Flavobacteriales bacterium]
MSLLHYRLLLFALAAVVVAGMGLDLMEVDAAQYAAMAREMLERKDYLHLYHRGHDYLDKPPLLFWLSALSYQVFGVSNWSYKLPSVLAAAWGLYALYRFVLLHYDAMRARRATLVFALSAAFLLMTNDVRCDTLLTSAVISAVWMGSAYLERRRWWSLIGFAVSLAVGLLAKGPLGAAVPLIALGGDAFVRERWRKWMDARLLIVPGVVLLLLFPMFVGLYEQHGWHGVRFFLWEQSFGRITGENRWKDDSSAFFFLHELPWLALPWTLFLIFGIFRGYRDLIDPARRYQHEHIALVGAVAVFAALSFSHFKLPHYLYVTLPLFAVLAANGIEDAPPWLVRAHGAILVLLGAGVGFVVLYCFPSNTGMVTLIALVITCGYAIRTTWQGRGSWVAATGALFIACALTINVWIYPAVLHYQANAFAGRWAAEHGVPEDRFFGLQVAGTALDLYAGHPVRWLSNLEEARAVIVPGVAVYTDAAHAKELRAAGFVPKDSLVMQDHRVQLLSLDFLLPGRRSKMLGSRVILVY